jgi:signal transduction histidine kinase
MPQVEPEAARRLNENVSMVDEISRQIRTISHLLHPPMLDEAGLASARRWYVDGFSGRSRIDVKLDMPSELERLPNEVELSIFRIVQECLTNVHRHSGSQSAAIRITHEDHSLRIEIEDDGRGASRDKQRAFDANSRSGVGIRGMRERLRRLNGTLEIGSNGCGTRVTATIPLQGTAAPMRQGLA